MLTQVGQQFHGMSEDFRIAKDHQDTIVAEAAYNALLQKREELESDPKTGFRNVQGYAAMGPQFFQDTAAKLKDASNSIAEGLTDPDQKLKFQQRAQIAATQFRGAILQHQSHEMNVFTDNTEANGVALGLHDIAVNWGDDAAFDSNLARIHGLIDARGMRKGLPAAESELTKAKALDEAWTSRIQAAKNDDPLRAMAMFRQHEKELGPHSQVVLAHELKVAVIPVNAKNAATRIMTGPLLEKMDTQMTVAGEPLVNAVISQESGGNQSAVSPKGALGAMQVMPDTGREVAADLGIPFDEQRLRTDAAYNKTLGTGYLNKQLTKYGGNQTLALAAYNAGPGKVDEWIQKFGDPRTGAITDADFAAKIPYKETREYVPKVLSRMGPGIAVQKGARDIRAQLAEWESQARLEADKDYPGDPIARDVYVSQIRGQVATLASAQEAKQRLAQNTVLGAAMALDGGQKPLTSDELLARPGVRDAMTHMDAPAIHGIMGVLSQNQREAAGEFSKSNPVVVKDLFRRINLDEGEPEKIRSRTQLAPFFANSDLNWGDYGRLSAEIDHSRTPEGNAFLRDVQRVRTTAGRMMKEGLLGRILADTQPEKVVEASYRFDMALDQKIDEYRKAGKDPRDLITPGKPDYMLSPERISTFLPSAKQTVSDKAAAVRAAGPQVAEGQIKTVYEVGKTYDFRQGKMRFKGGDAAAAANWEPAQ